MFIYFCFKNEKGTFILCNLLLPVFVLFSGQISDKRFISSDLLIARIGVK